MADESRQRGSDHTHFHLYAVGGEDMDSQTQGRHTHHHPTTFRTTSTAAVAIDECDDDMSEDNESNAGETGALEIHDVLKDINDHILQEDDQCLLSVALEDHRYLVIVAHKEGEAAILGCTKKQQQQDLDIAAVIPIERQSSIELSGDGGFHFHPFCQRKRVYVFKPSSVQSLWSAVQSLLKLLEVARHYDDKDSWHWLNEYKKKRKGCSTKELQSWYFEMERDSHLRELDRIRQESLEAAALANSSPNQMDEDFERKVIKKLKEMMFASDLDTITSKQLREGLEQHFGVNLKKYKKTIDQQMIVIMGQMEAASKIFDYLFLGTEWNASNWEELEANNCRYIINVTKEVPCFFPDRIKYHRVRLYDTPEADLLSHWDSTFRFIRIARENGSSVLIHCKMGVSRSASTVIAYCMKQYSWKLEEAHAYVKKKRSIIKPNEGFRAQLVIYEGMLRAKRQAGSWGKKLAARNYMLARHYPHHDPFDADDISAPASPVTSPGCSPVNSGISDDETSDEDMSPIDTKSFVRTSSVKERVSKYERRHRHRAAKREGRHLLVSSSMDTLSVSPPSRNLSEDDARHRRADEEPRSQRSQSVDTSTVERRSHGGRMPNRPVSMDGGSLADDEADRQSSMSEYYDEDRKKRARSAGLPVSHEEAQELEVVDSVSDVEIRTSSFTVARETTLNHSLSDLATGSGRLSDDHGVEVEHAQGHTTNHRALATEFDRSASAEPGLTSSSEPASGTADDVFNSMSAASRSLGHPDKVLERPQQGTRSKDARTAAHTKVQAAQSSDPLRSSSRSPFQEFSERRLARARLVGRSSSAGSEVASHAEEPPSLKTGDSISPRSKFVRYFSPILRRHPFTRSQSGPAMPVSPSRSDVTSASMFLETQIFARELSELRANMTRIEAVVAKLSHAVERLAQPSSISERETPSAASEADTSISFNSSTLSVPMSPGLSSEAVQLPADVEGWTTRHVCRWLSSIGKVELAPSFRENEVTGQDLLDLSHSDLQSIGVSKLSDRKAILRAVQALDISTDC